MKEIIGIWELNKGDLVKAPVTRELTNGEKITVEEVLKYDGMDGMYAKLWTEKGELLNATGHVKKEGDHYVFTEKK